MSSNQKRSMKVLVVEAPSPKEGAARRLSAAFMDSHHHNNNPESLPTVDAVLIAHSSSQVLDFFRTEHPDVVLIDFDDLGTTAYRLCGNIRLQETNRHTGIIFYSEKPYPNAGIDLERVLECGADDLIDGRAGDREFFARVASVFRFKIMTDRLRSANHRLKMLSLTDELTGLSNMRAFNIEYQKLVKACREKHTGLGIIMLDLDRFKSINDTANHLVGSFIIAEVGRLISNSGILLPGSVAARYGGDEYIIAVPTDDVEKLWKMASQIQDLVVHSVFKKEQYTFRITSSFGFSWAEPGFDGKSDDLIKGADVMLYRSKREGRNMISGMLLRYPVDFNNVGKPHLLERETPQKIRKES